jgi:RHS repeat-associated protein
MGGCKARSRITVVVIGTLIFSQFTPLPFAPTRVPRAFAASPKTTIRASVSSTGGQPNGSSGNSAISDDGRYVSFESSATNLIASDANGTLSDIFVRDLTLGVTRIASVSSSGVQGNFQSSFASISADGRYVAFQSKANNLVGGDTNGWEDVFVHDMLTGATDRVSVSSSGAQSNQDSSDPSVSADGRYVAFTSFASNLVTGDSNGNADVFLRDRQSGTTVLVSHTPTGASGNSSSSRPAISADGRYVVFDSTASNLLTGDINARTDVFLYDRTTANLAIVSRDSSGAQGGGNSFGAVISEDNVYVAFASEATNLVAGDSNARRDTFVRNLVAGTTTRISVDTAGVQGDNDSRWPPAISASGRYVAFTSLASNLIGVGEDTNSSHDTFVRDVIAQTTERDSVGVTGQQAASGVGSEETGISANGRYVTFSSTASNLVPGDSGTNNDAFVRDRGYSIPLEQTLGTGLSPYTAPTSAFSSDPVNTGTGNFTNSAEDATLPGIGLPFAFTRAYNSLDTNTGPLGPGWTYSYNLTLAIRWDGTATFRAEDGQQVVFIKQADGSYTGPPGGRATLSAISGGYDLTRPDQIHNIFDSGGKLTKIQDRTGHHLDLAYNAQNQLTKITDTVGRSITLSYDPTSGLLTGFTLPDSRSVSYGYGSGRLTSATDLRGNTVHYTYDSGGRLATIVDQNNHTLVTNTYGSDGRVTDQLDAFGNHTGFSWNAATQTATLTDARGKVWKDTYDAGELVKRTDPLNKDMALQYDANLNLTQVSDRLTNNWTLSFDARGNLLSRTAPAPLSFTQSWTYDAKNNPLTYTDGRNNTWLYEYDTSGRLTKETQPGGSFRTLTYTANGLPATISDFRGNVTTFTYDAAGNLTQVETPLGHKTTYAYDASGRLTSVVDPRGNEPGATPADYTTTYTYDASGNVLTETDALGKVTTYTYDSAGKLATITDPLGRVTTYTYNDAGELITEQAPGGRTTSYDYDVQGELTAVTAPGGRKTTYTYDDAGRVGTMVTPRGNVTGANPADYRWAYEYDDAGKLTKITDPLGGITQHVYDKAGRLLSTTDPRGKTTSFAYDANGNRTSVTDPLANVTASTFDSLNHLDTVTDPRGKITNYDYDVDGNLVALTTPLGNKKTFAYNAENHLANSVDPRGNAAGANPADFRWVYAYDAAGNKTSETDPLGNQTRWEFDRVGRLSQQIDALNHATSYTHDAIGRLTKVTAPDSSDTSYAYNTAGDLTTRTDALNHATVYDYDSAGRQSSQTSPLGQVWTYDYDAADNLIKIVDAAGNATPADPNDGTTSRTFDALNRLTAINYSDATPDVAYGYDAAGNRTSMTDGQGIETSTYDDAGRRTQVARGLNVFGYEYDAAGNVTKRTYPDATQVILGYDDDERLNSVTQGTAATSYSFDEAGNVILTVNANTTQESRTYDRAGRLSEVRHTKAGTPFAFATYTRDAVGNPNQVVTPDGTITYAYDNRDRITEACFAPGCSGIAPDGGDAFVRYTYDAVGNRLTQTRPLGQTSYTYNAGDQLTQEQAPTGNTAYSYDPNGNQTTAGATSYSYDLANRLIQSQQTGSTTTYAYDGDGKRAQATVSSPLPKTTNYVWDANAALPELVLERDAAGALIRRYVHGKDLISETSPDTINPALTQTEVLHPDGLGSTLAVTDSSGNTDYRYTYDPYGEARRQTQDDLLAPENRIRFTGALLDTETGLYHLRARQYDTHVGRLLSLDPLDREVGDSYVSAYTYADDRPTVLVDPSGRRGDSPVKRGLLAPPVAPPQIVPPATGGAAALCLSNPLAIAACAAAGGAAGGYLIYKWDPFNYSETFEDFGGSVYDWFTGDDDNNDHYLWRGGKKQRGNYRPRPDELDTGVSVWTTAQQAMLISGNKEAWGLGVIDVAAAGFFVRADPRINGHYFIFLADKGEMRRWSDKDDPRSAYWADRLRQTARRHAGL